MCMIFLPVTRCNLDVLLDLEYPNVLSLFDKPGVAGAILQTAL